MTVISHPKQTIIRKKISTQEPISAYPDNHTVNEIAEKIIVQARSRAQQLQMIPLKQRIKDLKILKHQLLTSFEPIVNQIVIETKKCHSDALISEIYSTLDFINWTIDNANKILSEERVKTPITLLGKYSRIVQEPYGVILIITPWNYPLYATMIPLISAFITGNSAIIKPSEITPLKSVLETLFKPCELLSLNVQVVYGNHAIAEALINQRPDKIFFTGSTETGKLISQQAAKQLIPVTLELGGKDNMIVFDDAAIDKAVSGALWGACTNSGQSCSSIEKLFVHENIYDTFIIKLKNSMQKLKHNTDNCIDRDIGGITTRSQLNSINRQIKDAVEQGAKILCGGTKTTSLSNKNYISPTLIANIKPTMAIYQEETFGPIIPIFSFSDQESLLLHLNQSKFALSASIWTQNIKQARKLASLLPVGAISINNVMLTEANPNLPFGGNNQSGYGRLKGKEGLLNFTRSKAIIVDRHTKKIEPYWYPYSKHKYQLFSKLIQALFGFSIFKWIKVLFYTIRLEQCSTNSTKSKAD